MPAWTSTRENSAPCQGTHSNTVERAIRPQTITRKSALFAGSHGGGRTWATIATLLQTAKMNDVDPHAWLTQTDREALADHSDRCAHALELQTLNGLSLTQLAAYLPVHHRCKGSSL